MHPPLHEAVAHLLEQFPTIALKVVGVLPI